ncbi:MAG: PH domain-containing protein [Bacteroidia bacterium]|nr:PH domain-containing protein [Bacteroidia bacterium]
MNNFSLDTPQRQSPLAIAFILAKFLRQAVRRFWPLVLIIIFNRGDSYFAWFLGFLLVMSFVQLVLSLISYYNYYFHVKGNELLIQKGVLQKTRLNIPFDRIQTINFQQNILHQILNVVSVEVDTAGSSKSELSIDALSREHAEALRNYILVKKEAIARETQSAEVPSEELPPSPTQSLASNSDKLVFTMGPVDLMKVGVSQNHIQTALVLLGSLFGLIQIFDDIREDAYTYIFEEIWVFQEVYGWIAFFAAFIIWLIAAFFVSMFRTALRYFNLKLWQTEKGFKIIAGLLNRREQSAAHQKIQIIRWFTDPLKQLFGLFTVSLYQASSREVSTRRAINIPGCYAPQLEEILSTNFPPEIRQNYTEHTISPRIISRQVLFFGVLPVVGFTTARLISGDMMGLLSLLWIPAVWLLSRRFQRRWRWWINEDTLMTRSGLIGTKFTLLHLYKVQSVKITQSPFQRKHALASVDLYTAAGNVSLQYIDFQLARKLRDYALYKAESDPRAWM